MKHDDPHGSYYDREDEEYNNLGFQAFPPGFKKATLLIVIILGLIALLS